MSSSQSPEFALEVTIFFFIRIVVVVKGPCGDEFHGVVMCVAVLAATLVASSHYSSCGGIDDGGSPSDALRVGDRGLETTDSPPETPDEGEVGN